MPGEGWTLYSEDDETGGQRDGLRLVKIFWRGVPLLPVPPPPPEELQQGFVLIWISQG